MAGKYWKIYGKNSKSKQWGNNTNHQKMCSVCGKNPAIIGNLCQTCKQFVKAQKINERKKELC